MRKYLEFIRFSHTVFALPFALLGCVWAVVVPTHDSVDLSSTQVAIRVLGVLLCMVCARSAAMAFNRLVDAEFDAANPRTANRHLPAGTLTRAQAWGFFAIVSLLFVAACALFLPNWLPLAGALPVLLWICGYSLAKRFTTLVHVWLGIALALSPVCAWIALRGEQVMVRLSDVWPAIGLGGAIACWVAGFDIIYACQDADFDARMRLRSVPARWGVQGALRWAAMFHLSMLVILAILPILYPQLSLGWLYTGAWLLVAMLVIRQHWILRPQGEQTIELGRINEAFFHINAVISFSLCALAAIDALIR